MKNLVSSSQSGLLAARLQSVLLVATFKKVCDKVGVVQYPHPLGAGTVRYRCNCNISILVLIGSTGEASHILRPILQSNTNGFLCQCQQTDVGQ